MSVLAVGVAVLLAGAFAPTAGIAAGFARLIDSTWMSFPPLPDDLRELAVRSTITDRHGERLSTVRDENRVLVDAEEIPEHTREAVIATEDRGFYEHDGVDWPAIARAAFGNVQAGEITGGGSTVTQQLIKNVVLSEPGEMAARTLDRKVQEAVYAMQLEERMGKDEILHQYLNTAYFANGVYGIGTAAEYYWGKQASELTVAQSALLAGMLRAPESHDPIEEPERAKSRRDLVLRQMVEVGFLTPGEVEEHQAEPLDTTGEGSEAVEQETNGRDAVTDYVIEFIKGREGDPQLPGVEALGATPEERFNKLATGGYEVRTTLHGELQAAAEQAIRQHLSTHRSGHAALTAVDPRTGELLAMGFGPHTYGDEGADFHPGVPGLGSPGRQTGSAYKVFGMLAALEDGVPPTYTTDTPSPYQPTGECAVQDPSWRPGNYSDAGGGVMDMYEATAQSSNVYFVHLVDTFTGSQALADVAQRMGVTSEVGANCSAVLGTSDLTVQDMAAAFGTLANEGERCDTYLIDEIVDRNGNVVYEGEGECEQAIERDVAARATDLLRGPIENGTASRHGPIGRPAAGKTGTSQNFGNAWFVGYIPQLSAGVWMGNERPSDQLTGYPGCPDGVTGGCIPTQVWATFMREAVSLLELPVEGFPSPPPLPTTTVPDVVGMAEEEAVATLEEAGFQAQVEEVEHYQDAGTVVGQTPTGGESAPARSAVLVEVSDGQGERPTMPSLIGMTPDEAREALAALDMDLSLSQVTTDVTDADEVDRVVAQDPGEGADLERGETVVIEVGERAPVDARPTPAPTRSPGPTPPPGRDDDFDAEEDPNPWATPEPQPRDEEDTAGSDPGERSAPLSRSNDPPPD